MIVPVSKLRSHPKNQEIYSLSNIEDLENSISSLGLLERLVIDDDFQVISGNRRLVAIDRIAFFGPLSVRLFGVLYSPLD